MLGLNLTNPIDRIQRGGGKVQVGSDGAVSVLPPAAKSVAITAADRPVFMGRQTSLTNVFGAAVLEIDTRGWANPTAGISIVSDGTNGGTLINTHLPNTAGNVLYVSHGNPWYLASQDNDPFSEVNVNTAVSRGSASMATRLSIGAGTSAATGWVVSRALHAFRKQTGQTRDLSVWGDTNYDPIADSGTKLARVDANGAATFAGVTLPSGQLLAPNGAVGTPAISFSGDPDTGFYKTGAGHIRVGIDGAGLFQFAVTGGFQLQTGTVISWSSGAIGATSDLVLLRSSANVLAQRNGINAQEQQWGETFTDASNYARLVVRTAAGDYLITPEAAGTGTLRGLQLVASGGRLGFFGVAAVARQVVPTGSTTDAVITALQNLGLFSQT